MPLFDGLLSDFVAPANVFRALLSPAADSNHILGLFLGLFTVVAFFGQLVTGWLHLLNRVTHHHCWRGKHGLGDFLVFFLTQKPTFANRFFLCRPVCSLVW